MTSEAAGSRSRVAPSGCPTGERQGAERATEGRADEQRIEPGPDGEQPNTDDRAQPERDGERRRPARAAGRGGRR